jgi:hypothetical protein
MLCPCIAAIIFKVWCISRGKKSYIGLVVEVRQKIQHNPAHTRSLASAVRSKSTIEAVTSKIEFLNISNVPDWSNNDQK